MAYTSLTSVVSTTMRWSAAEQSDLSTTTDSQTLNYTATKTLGDADGEANLIWSDRVAAATLTLASMARSVFGVSGTFTFTGIKSLRVRNTGEVDATITIPSVGLSSPVTLSAGAILILDSDSGWAVGAGEQIVVAAGGVDPLADSIEVVVVGVGTVTP